jgi:hypothetical protein
MEFTSLFEPFSDKQKLDSFLYLQKYILEQSDKNNTFFIGRLSGNEPNLCGRILSGMELSEKLLFEMLTAAGIQFTSNDDLKQYVTEYHNACINCSILSVWSGSMYMQAKPYYDLLQKIKPSYKSICAQVIEPYFFMDHPDYNLNIFFKNKKVLIITSHKETTLKQIKNHSTIHRKPIFDDTTDFLIYKPVQQNGGNHDKQSWNIHLNKMKQDLLDLQGKYDFDIALVSCGGFGMILSNYIFSYMKKSTIYVGGSLQLYFGIKGNRWNTHNIISKMINDKWCSVIEEDKPPSLSVKPYLCENSCYW